MALEHVSACLSKTLALDVPFVLEDENEWEGKRSNVKTKKKDRAQRLKKLDLGNFQSLLAPFNIILSSLVSLPRFYKLLELMEFHQGFKWGHGVNV